MYAGGNRKERIATRAAEFDLTEFLDRLVFFQAEDGIRDTSVTGVQTCALPISAAAAPNAASGSIRRSGSSCSRPGSRRRSGSRSEERRVGTELDRARLPHLRVQRAHLPSLPSTHPPSRSITS